MCPFPDWSFATQEEFRIKNLVLSFDFQTPHTLSLRKLASSLSPCLPHIDALYLVGHTFSQALPNMAQEFWDTVLSRCASLRKMHIRVSRTSNLSRLFVPSTVQELHIYHEERFIWATGQQSWDMLDRELCAMLSNSHPTQLRRLVFDDVQEQFWDAHPFLNELRDPSVSGFVLNETKALCADLGVEFEWVARADELGDIASGV